ncbi:L-serine dehydratase [Mycobacterium haemophilum DSM 44634]|uniref:L-serine ammonia-lyase n=1 Tax=Mycobacterium haemophilum TaxID=29311 RepID=UPI0006552620|nr:L-serine ammonia-lyase [Mycobacterium haemophilum]AKN18809.1 serine dehydratase [Mycobacterium haemophilum DSM 44634]MCV7340833.1 L-serine ammonia-lyase [Mycobacterium haemophilum DSM 44634]
MTISVFDLFTIGIGPSSSHTVGPMRAAARFVEGLAANGLLADVCDIRVELFGSLAATGAGHGTMSAILFGLEGEHPERLDADDMAARLACMRAAGTICLGGLTMIKFTEADIVLCPQTVLDRHPNAMTITAIARDGTKLAAETYYSVGGGFVVAHGDPPDSAERTTGGVSFGSAGELLELATTRGMSICELMAEHEQSLRPAQEVRAGLLNIRDVMTQCVARGITQDGYLPGGLKVRRRAHSWHERLLAEDPNRDPAFAEDWVNLVALAVNEENAAGGRVVTAPTNGAAGIIPAVLYYAQHYCPAGRADPDDTSVRFLLTAGAIGSLYKELASISGAEVGCQGEVGSAASMAAAGLAEILGGTPAQVENAAEIAMEHSLGLTCDPIAGLVQIPCIERNAISAGKAINAARMAMRGDGTHRVSLDEVIATMRATGRDMSSKYKETAEGGLAIAVNVVEC